MIKRTNADELQGILVAALNLLVAAVKLLHKVNRLASPPELVLVGDFSARAALQTSALAILWSGSLKESSTFNAVVTDDASPRGQY